MEKKTTPSILNTSEYIRSVWKDQWVLDAYDLLRKYCPEVVDGYMLLRQGAFAQPPSGHIPPKYKELVAVAIECARLVPAVGHARRAIEFGATPQEVAEIVSVCIQLGGMASYMHSGRQALQAAEECAKELNDQVARNEDA